MATQAERSEATQRALIDAGSTLFSGRGYADVGVDEIAATAAGALYHRPAIGARSPIRRWNRWRMLVGALKEGGIMIAGSTDPVATRAAVETSIRSLIAGVAIHP